MIEWLKKLFEVEEKEPVDTSKPCCWTLGWSGTIELGFPDGTYLPRRVALMTHSEYSRTENQYWICCQRINRRKCD